MSDVKDVQSTMTQGTNISDNKPKLEIVEDTEIILAEKYILYTSKKLGSGAFGEIFEGKSILTGELVACKVENKKAKHPQLHYEARILKALNITKRT
jgi:predicted Ser/Thr protein kinase